MRTFIAMDLPPTIQEVLVASQQLAMQCVDPHGNGRAVRWTPVEKVHLTLRFLGETSSEQCAELDGALTTISASQARFELGLNGLGCFPNCRRPSVIWLGIDGDLKALYPLQEQIETAARAAGFMPETRAYAPHLTIGRVQRNANSHTRRQIGAALQGCNKPMAAASFMVDHIIHVQSTLQPTGSIYSPIAQYWFM